MAISKHSTAGRSMTAGPATAPTGRKSRALQALSIAFAAFVTGSRTIPLGDNGALLRDLAARAGRANGMGD